MSEKKQYTLTNEDDIFRRIQDFDVARLECERRKKWDEVNSTSNTHIINCVVNYSNGDTLHYAVTAITLGDVRVAVVTLTLKIGDNVEIYLAPSRAALLGGLDEIAD